MPVTPPLDRIPAIPNQLVGIVNSTLSKQLDQLSKTVLDTVEMSIKLSEETNCDSLETTRLRESLQSVSNQISRLNDIIPIINQVNTAIQGAAAASAAIKAVQLLNPVTAPAVIAAELVTVQNLTISNAIQASKQLQQIPGQIQSTLQSLSADIAEALQNFSNICNNESFSFIEEVNSALDQQDDLQSEFYQTINVQQADIDDRNELINELIQTQIDLLSSLEEAPSQVFRQSGPPPEEIGKPGDYYVDTQNNVIYGPKLSRGPWPEGVNY